MTPRSSREVPGRERAHLEREAVHLRQTSSGVHRTPTTAREDAKLRRIRDNKVLIRGRYQGLSLVWDVFRILGPGRLLLAHAGCWCHEQAVALATDAIMNRTSVSFAGCRTLFGKSKADALSAPRKEDLVLPGDRPVKVTRRTDLESVVEGKDTTREEL